MQDELIVHPLVTLFQKGNNVDKCLYHLCRKEDVEAFTVFKESEKKASGRWSVGNHPYKTIPYTLTSVGSKLFCIPCNSCGELGDEYYIHNQSSKKYRVLVHNHPTSDYHCTGYELTTRLELESRRLASGRLLADLARLRLLDDRLLELLFDKLLEVLPFEITFMIIYQS